MKPMETKNYGPAKTSTGDITRHDRARHAREKRGSGAVKIPQMGLILPKIPPAGGAALRRHNAAPICEHGASNTYKNSKSRARQGTAFSFGLTKAQAAAARLTSTSLISAPAAASSLLDTAAISRVKRSNAASYNCRSE